MQKYSRPTVFNEWFTEKFPAEIGGLNILLLFEGTQVLLKAYWPMYVITHRKKKKVVHTLCTDFSERVIRMTYRKFTGWAFSHRERKLFPCGFLYLLSASPWESKLFCNTSLKLLLFKGGGRRDGGDNIWYLHYYYCTCDCVKL